MADPNALPIPPVPPSRLPDLVDEQLTGWRLHWEDDPRSPVAHPRGRWRFDAPLGEYLVTYTNQDRYACFAEVYGDTQEIAPSQIERRLSRMHSTRPLRILNLVDGRVLAALRLDLRISATVDYEKTMAWGKAFHDWYRDLDGVAYLGRHATTKVNRCLFLDRCAGALDFTRKGDLGNLRPTVMRAAAAYSLAPRLFDPGGACGWV